MDQLVHPPWVGSEYSRSQKRLLVLGESHHSDNAEDIDITRYVVQKWLDGETSRSLSFFTRLGIALTGQEPAEFDKAKLFGQISFYNYVQKVISGPRTAPQIADFEASEPDFRRVLDELKPTHIVACGQRLWENLPAFDWPSDNGLIVTLADKEFEVGRYVTPNSSPVAMRITHPQTGFDGRQWHPRLMAFLEPDVGSP